MTFDKYSRVIVDVVSRWVCLIFLFGARRTEWACALLSGLQPTCCSLIPVMLILISWLMRPTRFLHCKLTFRLGKIPCFSSYFHLNFSRHWGLLPVAIIPVVVCQKVIFCLHYFFSIYELEFSCVEELLLLSYLFNYSHIHFYQYGYIQNIQRTHIILKINNLI